MGRMLLLSWLASSLAHAVSPSRVLVLVNDSMPSETGTSGVGASVYVGTHYASVRSGANVLHLTCDTTQGSTRSNYLSQIETPVKAFLDASGGAMKHQILYIVPTYGIPIWIAGSPNIAVDGMLAAMYSPATFVSGTSVTNPYNVASPVGATTPIDNSLWVPTPVRPKPFEAFSDQRELGVLYKMFSVTRLDGLSAVKASALVDSAISAEASLRPTSGTAYWDWGGTRNATEWQLSIDLRVRDGGVLSYNKGVTTYLHRGTTSTFPDDPVPASPPVTNSGGLLTGTNALFLFSSVGLGFPTQGQFTWITGALGTGMVSCSGSNLRSPAAENPGTSDRWGCSWMGRLLEDGITGTWGAADEPCNTTCQYAQGIDVSDMFFSGYNFADSFYLSQPTLRWTMYAVGDPLYQPRGIVNPSNVQFRNSKPGTAVVAR